eukprot:TRINITY_DN14535_c0_g1_i3.p3 TRINITY_DN14535_c0_g1~~TRINITY_DN14535_c0_g1_i3.p3  ORF type:complete len:299 (+),score=68.04 TRINITY_DN14535_c0_g1_i3:1300-2196(+)
MRLWQVVWARAATQGYQWYLNIEDDVIVEWSAFATLVRDHQRLAGSGLQPALLRYGVGEDGLRYMTQAGCCCNTYPCQCDCDYPVRMLWKAAGEMWWEPGGGQYGAYTLASSSELRLLLSDSPYSFGRASVDRRAVRFTELEPGGAWGFDAGKGVRCRFPAGRAEGESGEVMTQAWPWGCPARVVPVHRADEVMAHHASNKYARRPVSPLWAPLRWEELAVCLGAGDRGAGKEYAWNWRSDGSVESAAFPPVRRTDKRKSGRGVLGFGAAGHMQNGSLRWMQWPGSTRPPCGGFEPAV